MSALAETMARTAKAGDVFLLDGTLGAGKSFFARAFIQSLCGAETEVPSPTFTLVQTYESSRGMLWHFDLYRIETPDDIFEIGWEDAISQGISLIEWPERLGPYTPPHARVIKINVTGKETREVVVSNEA